jgi:hypothetical protein
VPPVSLLFGALAKIPSRAAASRPRPLGDVNESVKYADIDANLRPANNLNMTIVEITGGMLRAGGIGGRCWRQSSIVLLSLVGDLHLGKFSETVVVHGNAPHNRPCCFMSSGRQLCKLPQLESANGEGPS